MAQSPLASVDDLALNFDEDMLAMPSTPTSKAHSTHSDESLEGGIREGRVRHPYVYACYPSFHYIPGTPPSTPNGYITRTSVDPWLVLIFADRSIHLVESSTIPPT